ncbi:MAG: class I SAM-dependent methyltransferase [Cyanobacteria bacterium]|nr:class I SAM-dependent methyltransferase [Cyanobacteriota bacterium]
MESAYEFNAASRRINKLISLLGYESYLEIGVRDGDTLFAVEAIHRTGVDPFFAFDIETKSAESGLDLHPKTSDKFFSNLEYSVKYDIVLIDGLHTYDQTYRDVLNALLHSHPKTVILIDDTVPCDVFSCLRDPNSCIQLRRSHGRIEDGRWHGDTFKTIPLLRLFNPDYRILTVVDSGNPQTFLWKPLRHANPRSEKTETAFKAVNTLAQCDYIWFLQNHDLYNPCSEEEAIEQIVNDLTELV